MVVNNENVRRDGKSAMSKRLAQIKNEIKLSKSKDDLIH